MLLGLSLHMQAVDFGSWRTAKEKTYQVKKWLDKPAGRAKEFVIKHKKPLLVVGAAAVSALLAGLSIHAIAQVNKDVNKVMLEDGVEPKYKNYLLAAKAGGVCGLIAALTKQEKINNLDPDLFVWGDVSAILENDGLLMSLAKIMAIPIGELKKELQHSLESLKQPLKLNNP